MSTGCYVFKSFVNSIMTRAYCLGENLAGGLLSSSACNSVAGGSPCTMAVAVVCPVTIELEPDV
jgi:hypothetical protein